MNFKKVFVMSLTMVLSVSSVDSNAMNDGKKGQLNSDLQLRLELSQKWEAQWLKNEQDWRARMAAQGQEITKEQEESYAKIRQERARLYLGVEKDWRASMAAQGEVVSEEQEQRLQAIKKAWSAVNPEFEQTWDANAAWFRDNAEHQARFKGGLEHTAKLEQQRQEWRERMAAEGTVITEAQEFEFEQTMGVRVATNVLLQKIWQASIEERPEMKAAKEEEVKALTVKRDSLLQRAWDSSRPEKN